ncbi:zinc-binding alcohol dehydrogenase family protein [Massilia atriviolacea]|uniref:Zinc-type alcohol dehydrogenase-like protein n=1 Tax=Massilia atriviolacea TaxID=2495579 RepID=A0A430HL54_9BURK|nr:zinc-binding alcohol dehydrogenase family protein [Massilia atriviolacea]RSZ58232.1 zinc-binding alcohol dehydrogenase family protein [Massilia atriviolacea]
MKAIAVINGALHDVNLPVPQPQGRDLVVRVEAISVNPVDFKQRKAAAHDGEPQLLGWDVAGTVSAVGPQASLFKVGDAVYYAGSVVRPGANSEFHAVDERIVGRKPASLSAEQAAALPLTSITAWEALFERLGVSRSGADEGKSVLMIGGAGGVGSIAIQLAKKLAKLNVIATASRRASSQWCRALGADHVIDHHGDMPAQLAALGLAQVDFILCLNDIDPHFAAMATAIAPQGKICAIVRNERPLPMDLLFAKSVTMVFEMMFTRSMFGTADMIEQHTLLGEVAALVDAGVLTTTLGENGGRIDAANLARAHAALEAGRTIGKIVLSGF